MLDRDAEIEKFLLRTPCSGWLKTPIAEDASARSYLRLTSGKKSVILMDAPPDKSGSTWPFVEIAQFLCGVELSAPRVLKHDPDNGLVLLEDLGRNDFARHIECNPQETSQLYLAATEVLIWLNKTPAPSSLTVMTPTVAAEMLSVTEEWYLPSGSLTDVKNSLRSNLTRYAGPPEVLALRDFHVENLIWRPDKTGLGRVGLLDFQDAFLAPAGYDLASLLRDARRQVSSDLAEQMIANFATMSAIDIGTLKTAFHCLAIQRNLRILGIFSRLSLRDNKHRYLAFVPHVWSMICADLEHPLLSELRQVCVECLPPPDASRLKDLL